MLALVFTQTTKSKLWTIPHKDFMPMSTHVYYFDTTTESHLDITEAVFSSKMIPHEIRHYAEHSEIEFNVDLKGEVRMVLAPLTDIVRRESI